MRPNAIALIALACLLSFSTRLCRGEISQTIELLNYEKAVPPDGRTSTHKYFVYGYDAETVRDLLSILRDPAFQQHWERGFMAMGIVASVDPSAVGFRDLASLVENLETQQVAVRSETFLPILGQAYGALGRYGGDEALEFLKRRTDAAFWGASLPKHIYPSGTGKGDLVLTGQRQALEGISYHPSDEAERYLRFLQTQPQFSADPVLSRALANRLELWSLEKNLAAERQAVFAEKYGLALNSTPSLPPQERKATPSTQPTVAVSSSAPPVTAQDAGSPIAKPDAAAKSPATTTRSSYPLLLIIGVLLCVVVAFLFLRRKP